MKKNLIIFVGTIGLIIAVILLFIYRNKSESINLNEQTWINQLTKIKIKGTNDSFEITSFVKWQNNSTSDVQQSGTILIPYTFVIDGITYDGTYYLGDDVYLEDTNPKYGLEIIDLTKEGDMQIMIKEK